MRATLMYGAGDVRVENVPDPRIEEPTDAILRIVRACICGSDLWPYTSMEPTEAGESKGHEALTTACVHVSFFGNAGMNGAQAEALRIPYADGTLYPLPVGEDEALLA